MDVKTKYDKNTIDEMCRIIEAYTDETEIPILKEVCYLNYWTYGSITKLSERNPFICQSIKRLLDKKEAQLERLALLNKINCTQSIFSLKQLGWRDRQEFTTQEEDGLKQMAQALVESAKQINRGNTNEPKV